MASDRGSNDPGMKGRRNSSRRKLAADRRGSISVENAIVFGLLIVLTIALIEFSLALWQWNTAEKATELGVRYAVQSDPVALAFLNYDAVSGGDFDPGDLITTTGPLPSFTISCTSGACKCSDKVGNLACDAFSAGLSTGTRDDFDPIAFDAVITRMDGVFRGSDLGPDNVRIDYSHVGVGFAGRPGMHIVPAVTVRLDGVTFDFMVLSFIRPLMFYGSEQPTTSGFPMPPVTATLSGEDLNSAGAS